MTLHAGAHVHSEYYFNFFHFLPFSLAVGNIHSVPELQFLFLHPYCMVIEFSVTTLFQGIH